VVTGIGSGIGRACALMLARHGAVVSGCDIHSKSAQATQDSANQLGLSIRSMRPCNLTQPAVVQKWVDDAAKESRGANVLVNAAVWAAMAAIEALDYEAGWKRTLVFELDTFFACKAAWPQLKANGGSIINFASANAYQAL
jgi:NAD(P)-dependent dehydrogenase (short-subunit alcohol dehydrogenase family)